MILPMMFSASRLAPWQAMYTYAGTYSWIVPEGCTSIAGVTIAPGGGGACGAESDTNESPAGGGGALSYSNAIPVTPGETLTIVVPAGGGPGGTMSNGSAAADAGIKRGATWLLMAQGGRGGNWASGIGGDGGLASMGVGDVRYSGGKGQDATNFTYGGWSGRYTGNGVGGGASQTNLSANLFGADTGTNLGQGGRGGRSSADPGNSGGVRIMWGDDRAFPGNAEDIVRPGWWKFWRIYITAVGSGSVAGLAEIELRATAGGADLTSPSTPMGASSNNAASLVDNNTSLAWTTASTGSPWWAWADLSASNYGQAQPAVELALWPSGSSTASVSPTDFIVQGSLDGTTWTDIKSFSGVTGWTAGTPKIFSLT